MASCRFKLLRTQERLANGLEHDLLSAGNHGRGVGLYGG